MALNWLKFEKTVHMRHFAAHNSSNTGACIPSGAYATIGLSGTFDQGTLVILGLVA